MTVQSQTDDLAKLVSELGVALPPGVRVIWMQREAGMDDMIRAKVRMTSAEFQALSNKLGFDARDMRAGPGRLGVDSGQWNPRSTAGIQSIQLPRSNARFLNLGVAEEEGETMTVFIMQHGT